MSILFINFSLWILNNVSYLMYTVVILNRNLFNILVLLGFHLRNNVIIIHISRNSTSRIQRKHLFSFLTHKILVWVFVSTLLHNGSNDYCY